MTNPIEYLKSKGFRVTSDPNTYASGKWGLRNYTVDGYNYDHYCGGYHRAYDFGREDGAPIPSIANNGVVVSGTGDYGNFGGTVVVAYEDLGIQVIYGHLKRPIPVKIGDKVKQGDVIGRQGNTNYAGVRMDSHLHIQFQNIGYIATEKEFVCSGIDPLNIDINKTKKNENTTKGTDIVANYKIVNKWTPKSMYGVKAPYAMTPQYITVHNTGNTASARNEIAYMNSNWNQTSYHVAIDDKEAVQAIPFNRNAWHSGDGQGNGNRKSIGIEICYSMDNGYSGAKSARYKKAEENAALYIAHVLHQYGWGMDRLKRHYDWSGKDCPHKMHATNSYQAFRNRVQAHLNALKKGSTASKPAPSKPKPKPSKKPSASKPKTPRTIGSWQTNKVNGAQYIRAEGTFTVTANDGIVSRFHNPSTNAKHGGLAKKGWSTKYDYLVRANGYVWIQYKVNGKGPWKFLPYNVWDAKTGAVGKTAWGTFS